MNPTNEKVDPNRVRPEGAKYSSIQKGARALETEENWTAKKRTDRVLTSRDVAALKNPKRTCALRARLQHYQL